MEEVADVARCLSTPTLREGGLAAEVSEIPAKTFIGMRARRLDAGLCCLAEDAAVQLYREDVASSWGHH